jgi:hypothetical protein
LLHYSRAIADIDVLAHTGSRGGKCITGFEFLFSFYGLLLGLAVANVATSFADMWRGRTEWAVGVAPPLLGLFILLAAAQQWTSFWAGRASLTMGPWEVLTAMGMALPYIFTSQAMFPRKLDTGSSIEDYYLAHRRVLMGMLMVPPVVSLCYNIFVSSRAPLPVLAFQSPALLIPLSLALWNNRWAHYLGLVLLCLYMLMRLFA